MSKSTHTPGPWTGSGLPFTDAVIKGPGGQIVAEAYASVDDEDGPRIHCSEAGANADLIAAAPDLLAALEMVLCRFMRREIHHG